MSTSDIPTDDDLKRTFWRVMQNVESGKLKVPHAVEITNAGGKFLTLRKIQLEESKLRFLIDTREMRIPLIDEEGRAPKQITRK